MGNKKKGASGGDAKKSMKTSKLAKMNEQERVKYMERKMAEEEESRRRKEEMIQAFLKIKLNKEERAVRINSNKIVEHWRNILREKKTKSLQKDISILKETFERALAKKNRHIEILLKDLSESEEQYNMVFRNQIQSMNELTKIHDARLSTFVELHDKERRSLLDRSQAQHEALDKTQSLTEGYLEDVILAAEERHNAIEQNLLRNYQQIRDEVRNKNMEEKQTLQLFKEERIENLMKKIRHQIHQHQGSTVDKRKLYNELLEKDKKDLKEAAENSQKIENLIDESNLLKQRLQSLLESEAKKLTHLRREKEELSHTLSQSRKEIRVQHRNTEESKLKKFAVMLNGLQMAASGLMDKYDSVIKIAQQCQRLEVVNDHLRPASFEKSENYADFLFHKMNSVSIENASYQIENSRLEKKQNEQKLVLDAYVKRALRDFGVKENSHIIRGSRV